jgi:hypothetical protein
VATLVTVIATPALPAQGPADLSAARPGRDPRQPLDSGYTRKIREYTTESFFLSPLVDYLPAAPGVPTPAAVLGDIAGAPDILPYSAQVYDYLRRLAKASPRVRVFSIGTTEEGREMVAVAVASEGLMTRLDANRADLAKLADPRAIRFDDSLADRIARRAAPVYYITGTIHSPEAGAPTALMELAYRLAVDESPYIRNIREHVITLITPIVEVDGRDRQVDLFNWHLKHPDETWPSLIYWGHYVAHDNNRDAMALTLALSQHVLDTYVGWKAQVLHDLHESGSFLYDNTIGDGPYNAWLDPLLTNEWQMIGWNNVQEMTRMGMPGVFAHGDFDTWSPGYLMFMAATHNGISRLYETFGNGGTAETLQRTLSPGETARTWFRQNPPVPYVKWSIRDNNNYEETGLLVSLSYVANNRLQLLRNFYEKSKRSIAKPRTEGPAAYVFPADDPRPGAQAALLRLMQKQWVEVSRATAPFTVTLPARPATGRGGRGNGDAPAAATTRTFPAGSYVVRMDQPYARIADALLDYQYWSPNDPQKNPYDDTGWTFPEGFATIALRVTDTTVLHAAMTLVTDSVRAPGGISGTGAILVVNNTGDNALAPFRYRLGPADVQVAEDSFTIGGTAFRRGTLVVRNADRAATERLLDSLGLQATATGSMPAVATHPSHAARTAILHTWSGTQTEGWWRLAFDKLGVPYDYISVQDVAKTADLRAKYDVILFPPAGSSGQGIIDGLPMWRNPMPWKHSDETPNIGTWAQTDDIRPGLGWDGMQHLQEFVQHGGVLVTVGNTADFAVNYGLTQGVSLSQAPRGQVVGSLLRTRVVDAASPIAYGVGDGLAVYSEDGESFGVSNSRGGRGGGGFGGGGENRPTGRGTPDDPDVVQGMPALGPAYQAPPRTRVEPWQVAPVTDDQLRNPLNLIPPDQRPRVILRFSESRDLLVSGLLGGSGMAQRPMVVDAPTGQGHVVLFANNPVYRGETIGSYPLVLNILMNFDQLNAGRTVEAR